MGVGEGGLDQEIDRLIVEHVEMIAIDPCDTAMTVTHVLAQTNIGDRDHFRAFRLDGAECFLDHATFGISAARLFVFFSRNSEKKDGLQSVAAVLEPKLQVFDEGGDRVV